MLEAVVTIGAGVVFIIWPDATVLTLALIAGVYFAVRGLTVIAASVRKRAPGSNG